MASSVAYSSSTKDQPKLCDSVWYDVALRKARNCAFVVAVLSRKNSRTSTACCANESRLSATAIPMTNLPPLIRTMPSGTSVSAVDAAMRAARAVQRRWLMTVMTSGLHVTTEVCANTALPPGNTTNEG